ncbi:MAG: hypothetical protein KC613_00810 [Myxococcales bacterium]|nr:hypothetical protein [Myxococcales bacterium]
MTHPADAPIDDVDSPLRPLIGIVGGAILGGSLYAVGRGILPPQLTVIAVVIGLFSGVGARLLRAIGTPAQLRVLVFASLFALLIAEFVTFRSEAADLDASQFTFWLLDRPFWLLMTVVFLVLGIFFGVRILVGNDPLGDVLALGGAVIPGGRGSPCPRCGSVQTEVDPQSLALHCTACDHTWREDDGPP